MKTMQFSKYFSRLNNLHFPSRLNHSYPKELLIHWILLLSDSLNWCFGYLDYFAASNALNFGLFLYKRRGDLYCYFQKYAFNAMQLSIHQYIHACKIIIITSQRVKWRLREMIKFLFRYAFINHRALNAIFTAQLIIFRRINL